MEFYSLVTPFRVSLNSGRVVSTLIGISILYWSFLGYDKIRVAEDFSIVRVFILVINATVGALFLFRDPVEDTTKFSDKLLVTLSLAGGGLALQHSGNPNDWPLFASWGFAIGFSITLSSLICLGKSFAVLPAQRTLVTKGPYFWVRHPVYLGELIMVASLCFAEPTWMSVFLFISILAMIVMRIRIEENILSEGTHYASYAEKVRFRILPCIW